jgi:hypothetical protein
MFLGNSVSGVSNGNTEHAALSCLAGYVYSATFQVVFHRIGEQVEKHLSKSLLIRLHMPSTVDGRVVSDQDISLLGDWPNESQCILNDLLEIDCLRGQRESAGLDASKIENFINQA